MQKKHILLGIMLLYIIPIFSQNLSKLYLSYEYSNQIHYSKIKIPSPYVTKQVIYPTKGKGTHMVTLGYKFNKHWAAEVGYYSKYYETGIQFNFPRNYFWSGFATTIDLARSIPIRCIYTPFKVNVFKRPLSLNLSAGTTIIKSGYYRNGFLGGGNTVEKLYNEEDPNDYVIYKKQFNHRVEAGIAPYFLLFEGRIQLEYRLLEFLSLTGTFGYAKSPKPLGYYRGSYELSTEKITYNYENVSYGEHIYKNIGIKIYPFFYKKKSNKLYGASPKSSEKIRHNENKWFLTKSIFPKVLICFFALSN